MNISELLKLLMLAGGLRLPRTWVTMFRAPDDARRQLGMEINFTWNLTSKMCPGGFKHVLCSILIYVYIYMGIIIPTDELHHFSRWLLHHQPVPFSNRFDRTTMMKHCWCRHGDQVFSRRTRHPLNGLATVR